MIPYIEFVYSWIYDNGRRESRLIREKIEKQGDVYPSPEEIKEEMGKCEKNWRKEEKGILKELSEIMKWKWNEKKIKCYIVGWGRSISDPLTISLSNKGWQFIDTLSHELIHQLQSQNSLKMKRWWEYVDKVYEKETKLTKNHILLHAVHAKLLKEKYGEKRLKINIVRSKNSPDYERSWEIVNREGFDSIIKKFREVSA